MIVTVGNTKGGVGKTTLAVQLAICRALSGREVWLIDGDRQGTATTAIAARAEAGRKPGIACAQYADGPTLRGQVQRGFIAAQLLLRTRDQLMHVLAAYIQLFRDFRQGKILVTVQAQRLALLLRQQPAVAGQQRAHFHVVHQPPFGAFGVGHGRSSLPALSGNMA